jgi:beta-glucanase (GH16 family)
MHQKLLFLKLNVLLSGKFTALVLMCSLVGCKQEANEVETDLIQVENYTTGTDHVQKTETYVRIPADNHITINVDVPATGRYQVEVFGSSDNGTIWIEDYINNTDDRTYNITGDIKFAHNNSFHSSSMFGSPLSEGSHPFKIHAKNGTVNIDWIKLTPILVHDSTYEVLEQKMQGSQWDLVWSDEFDVNGLPDTSKWSYNIGNWGWGNNELQYYTAFDEKTARVEDGNLIIQAHQDKSDSTWTSARLTTQGKFGFKYGKIEFRAKVPHDRGTWAAGWLLGSNYKDEISWPYCGEIDVLECVGYEINDTTFAGLNHATCHTRKYYFKQGNQIGSDTTLTHMTDSFHTYAVEWHPDVIYGLVDGKRYYTYDKNADDLEWPFNKPQDIILNLAIGGGWGGAKGLDPNMDAPQYILDYVRVYDLK